MILKQVELVKNTINSTSIVYYIIFFWICQPFKFKKSPEIRKFLEKFFQCLCPIIIVVLEIISLILLRNDNLN